MLSDVESKITAVVGDGLRARTHVEVLEAPQPMPSLEPGRGAVRVAVTTVSPSPAAFEREAFLLRERNGSAESQRVVELELVTRIDFRLRPPTTGPDEAANLAAARRLLLEDMSFVSHRLAASSVRNGAVFAVAVPDPGFQVHSFVLDRGNVATDSVDGLLAGELDYHGRAKIWPTGEAAPEGIIDAIETLVAPLPLRVVSDRSAVAVGSSTNVRVPVLPSIRLRNVDSGERAPVEIAVKVVSDLPFDRRGTIPSGRPGAEAGLRILESTGPETVLTYLAPTGEIGSTRREYVAVHLATPEDGSGLLLGSVAIALLSSSP